MQEKPVYRTSNIRTMVRGAYDLQKLRIQTGNRIVGNFKVKLGQAPSKPEEEMDAQGRQILRDLRAEYKRITDGLTTLPRLKTFKGSEIISDYTELCLMAQYLELESTETAHFRRLGRILMEYPIYSDWLRTVKGIGPAMAGVLLSEIDITRAQYASSLWKYAGLDVAEDGAGRSRREAHLVKRKYISKDGEEKERNSITFNPFLKTKLFVLGSSFLRAGENPYQAIYHAYKNRLENHPKHIEKTKLHRHNMALRYMIKRFLVDLYVHWRALEGLPVALEYSEAKLGIEHKVA